MLSVAKSIPSSTTLLRTTSNPLSLKCGMPLLVDSTIAEFISRPVTFNPYSQELL